MYLVPVREGGIDYGYQRDLFNMANEELINGMMEIEAENKEILAKIEKYELGRKSETQNEKLHAEQMQAQITDQVSSRIDWVHQNGQEQVMQTQPTPIQMI